MTERQRDIRSKVDVQFRKHWDLCTQAGGSGSFLKKIKDKIANWEHANVSSRIETALTKVRLGHVALNQYLFRFQQADSPLCACGEVESVEHYIMACPLQNSHRNRLHVLLRILNLDNNDISLKLLSGGLDCDRYTQKLITKYVGIYLKNTGRLEQL